MNSEKYNLEWHSYTDHLRNMLHEMRKSNDLTDVTLVCDDKRQFKAHKVVLRACSSVFKSIINELPQNNSVIYLRGVQHQEMDAILEFIYKGATTFYQNRMDEFLKVAASLEIKEINAKGQCQPKESNIKTEVSEYQDTEEAREAENNVLPKKDLVDDSMNVSHIDQSLGPEHYKNLDIPLWQCPECEISFENPDKMGRHYDAYHKGHGFPCTYCGYKSKRKDHLKVHIESKHEGLKFPCNHCEYQATTQGSLVRHVKRRHTTTDI